jgi:type VI secretion system secreted protein VgrG
MNAHVLPATLTDANRPIRLRFDSRTDIPDDLLMVQHVSGSETMFGGLEYVLLCVSTRAGQQLKHIIASPVAIQFVTDTGAPCSCWRKPAIPGCFAMPARSI